MANRPFEDFGTCPDGEGIMTMNMDTRRGRLYGITWPTGHFCYYDLARGSDKEPGPVRRQGEAGKGPDYRTLCRSMAVDPADGSVYFSVGRRRNLPLSLPTGYASNGPGRRPPQGLLRSLRSDLPGHMGYNWRQVFWHPDENVIYGVHGNSGYLFRYRPARQSHGRAGPAHFAPLEAQRHVRPVQLWLPGIQARPRQADDLLPDRRADLRRAESA